MSHEIRTPMTAILGFTELIRDELGENAQAEDAIETIQRNGRHLLDIIDGILDLSKIEADKIEIEHLPCSPTQLIGDTLKLMQIRASAKGIQLGTQYLGQLPEIIWTDPTRLKQILLNLVGNAIKFTDHGSVRLRVQAMQLDGGSPGLRIDVIDTGIGMDDGQLERLFQPFAQADSSTTRRFGGTGLGLTISRRLAELLDGTLEVTSQPGLGSCFSLTMAIGVRGEFAAQDDERLHARRQVAAPVATTTRSVNAVTDALKDCRVLLVEDGPDNQRLISFVLRKAGATVTIVDNGLKALEQLTGLSSLAAIEAAGPQSLPLPSAHLHPAQPCDFDIVLLDMQMPVLDGYTTANYLRGFGFSKPIVALTAHAMEGERDKCLAAGCDEYATKPIDRNALIQLIARLTAVASFSDD